MPDSLSFDTVPGQPGTTLARLVMIDSPIAASKREEIIPGQSFTSSQEIRTEIAKVLLNSLKKEKIKLPSGWLDRNIAILQGKISAHTWSYSPQAGVATDSPRDQRFKDLCVKFGAKLGETVNELKSIVKDVKNDSEMGMLSEFYALTNKDIIAVETMQDALWEHEVKYKFQFQKGARWRGVGA
jgi:hypothetical protein